MHVRLTWVGDHEPGLIAKVIERKEHQMIVRLDEDYDFEEKILELGSDGRWYDVNDCQSPIEVENI